MASPRRRGNSDRESTAKARRSGARAAKAVKDFRQRNTCATVMSAAERALGIKMPR